MNRIIPFLLKRKREIIFCGILEKKIWDESLKFFVALLLDAVCVSGEDVAASAAVNGDDGVGVSVQDHGFRC